MRVAISMVRDEEDIIAHTLEQMLTQVDHVIIADNLSVDNTREIIESFDRVTVIEDNKEGYYQADKMTNLARMAGGIVGADWIIPFDADEAWWLPNLEELDADVVESRPLVYVPFRETEDPNPIYRFQWRLPEPEPFKKVCFRYHPEARLHMGQHDVDRIGNRTDGSVIRHYQYRSLEQVRRKVSNGVGAYNASTLPAFYGAHWRDLNALTDEQLEQWWEGYTSQPLVFAP